MNVITKTFMKEQTIKDSPIKEESLSGGVENKEFNIPFDKKMYKVFADTEEEAIEKLYSFFGKEAPKVELKEEEPITNETEKTKVSIKDIFLAIAEEINRIVTVAHPEAVNNSYDRWIAVLTEELGEIVHEINDAYEGKAPNKNLFVECVQLASATILLAKKYADENFKEFK